MSEDFGDFGFVEDEEKKAKVTASPKSKPRRKASQRRGDLYAKSPQQRMQEAQKEQDFQEALKVEQDRQYVLVDHRRPSLTALPSFSLPLPLTKLFVPHT